MLTTQYRSREEISGFASLAPPIQNMWLSTLVKADAVEEVREARVPAHWIKERMHFQPLQNALPFVVRPFKPYKRLVIVAEPQVRVNERGSLDVTCLPALLQFLKQPKGFGTVAGARVRCG